MSSVATPPTPVTKTAEERKLAAMGFLQHLEELRQRLIRSVVFIVAGFGVAWVYHEKIFAWVQKPIVTALNNHHMDTQLVYTNPTEPFNIYLKVSLIAGIFLASPFVLYQIWGFISPGLYRHEKRYVLPFMFSTVGLFTLGGMFGYYMVYPAALDFLIGWSAQFKPMITIGEYLDLFMTIMLGLGAIFEMPILAFFLALFGVVSAGWMWRNLRYAILVIFIIAAILTPTTDLMNMCMFAAPMIILYLVSIGVAFLVHPKQRRKRAQKA